MRICLHAVDLIMRYKEARVKILALAPSTSNPSYHILYS